MRTWFRNHPITITLSVAVFSMAAGAALATYILSSALILPLI